MEQILNQFNTSLGGSALAVFGAMLFFLIGWIVALILGSLTRKLMAKINVNGKLNHSKHAGGGTNFEKIAARLVFWLVLIIAVTGALNVLQLDALSAPFANLVNEITSFLPRIIAASLVALVGWAAATVVRVGVGAALNQT